MAGEARTYPCDWKSETVRVKDLVRATLVKLQMPKLNIPISWSDSTRSFGMARWSPVKNMTSVEFSLVLWPYLPLHERDDTVVHEVCHIVARELYAPKKIKPHGEEWQRLMWLCGLEPKATCAVPIPTHITQKCLVYCNCKSHQVTPSRLAQIQTKSKVFACKSCKAILQLRKPETLNE